VLNNVLIFQRYIWREQNPNILEETCNLRLTKDRHSPDTGDATVNNDPIFIEMPDYLIIKKMPYLCNRKFKCI